MKPTFKLLLKVFLITLVIFVVAIAAAPLFVRQDQIKSFIQNKVVLAEGSKLSIDGDISFGIFPYSFVKVPKAIIIDRNAVVTSIDNIKFGFKLSNLLKRTVTFDIGFKIDPAVYIGHIEFKDYQNFLRHGESPVVINLEKPLVIEAEADFSRVMDKISLNNIKATHKQTQMTGNFESVFSGNTQYIKVIGTIDTQNLDDLRKLYKIAEVDNYNIENDFSLFSGIGKIDFNLTTDGVKAEDFIANLNGAGSVGISEATIYGLDFNEIIGAPQDVKIERNYDRKFEINKADATFTIANGIVTTEDLTFSNQLANARAKGQADLNLQILAFNLDIDADLASAQVNIPLTVSGNFDDLKVRPRAEDALLNNINALQNVSKIKLNDVKLNLGKEAISNSLDRIKNIGEGLGLDVNSIIRKNKKLKKLEEGLEEKTPAEAAPAPAPAATEPAPAPAQ